MLSFKLIANGQSGFKIRQLLKQPKRLRPFVRAALAWASRQYATGRMRPSILDRFGRAAFGTYGLMARSKTYRARQGRDLRLMGPSAFTGPRPNNLGAVLRAAARIGSSGTAAGAMTATANSLTELAKSAGKPHMRDLVTIPGVGHRIMSTGMSQATVRITWPAARPLNGNPRYAQEFRDLTLGGGRDFKAITAVAGRKFAAMRLDREPPPESST